MKKCFLLVVGVSLSLLGFSQTIRQQVEREIRNPERKAAEGKADVVITDKKKIFDSTTLNSSSTKVLDSKKVNARARKPKCSHKAKQKEEQMF